MRRTEPPVDTIEWEAQERGMRVAQGREPVELDPEAERYRRVAMALRSAPLGEPPPGFAADIAARAMQGNGDGIERSLVRGFTIVLAASLLAMPVLYGPQWWEAMQSVMTVGSLRLVLAGAACLGLSWILPRRALASRAGAMSR